MPQKDEAAEPRESKRGDKRGKKDFLFVGIGASAGGVEAFRKFLAALTPEMRMAYFVILHMGEVKSMLTEILARETSLPVVEAKDGMRPEQGTVYVMPSGSDMVMANGVLRLQARGAGPTRHVPIDTFFRSLAEDRGARAVGIVLTGADSDGMLGLAAIKGSGGLTFAQDPETAAYPAMPRHAINARVTDLVLPIPQIVEELRQVSDRLLQGSPLADIVLPDKERSTFNSILDTLRKRTGVDFQRYKESTIQRRIARRLAILRVNSLEEYLARLQESPDEVDALYQDILIMVTQFFRDPETFEILQSDVFPNILQRKKDDQPWRFWVIGCSTGQEAYTLGICLLEFFGSGSRPPVQLFATDVNDHDIAHARTGIYPSTIATEMSDLRLKRFFDQIPEGYQVKKGLREMCIFAKHDVTRDPPFTRLDAIMCRNVLIYFRPAMQERLIPLFHYALHPSGFLSLGTSESVGRHGNLFELIDKKNRIYARKPGRGELPFEFGQNLSLAPAEARVGSEIRREMPELAFDVTREADRIAAGVYAPASVVVSEDLRILNFRGDTSPYLSHPPGAASFDLLQMSREGLGAPLREAVAQAKVYSRIIRRSGIRLRTREGESTVEVSVIPFHAPNGDTYFLVSFGQAQLPAPGAEEAAPAEKAQDEYESLRDELVMTREHLQTVIRDKESALEELRAAYEEIQSSNEELQSINEELETAKEELQSINEELTTVNEELQLRNQDLTRAHDDLRNLLANIDIPILMLDQDLKIRSYTPGTERLLRIIPGDIGRPLADFRMRVQIPELGDMIIRATQDVAPQEKEVRDDETGNWYAVSVRPYKTGDMRIGGAVVSFVDVSELKRSVEVSRESAQLSGILTAIGSALAVETDPTRIIASLMETTAGALHAPVALLVTTRKTGWKVEHVYQVPPEVVGTVIPATELRPAGEARRQSKAVLGKVGGGDGSSLLDRLGVSNAIAIPLRLRDDAAAILVLGYKGAERPLSGATIDFAERVAIALTLALENAELRRAERTLADSMREDLAPRLEPIIEVDMGHVYHTALEAEHVGGDFLDVVSLDTSTALILIGDVVGVGLRAAQVAAQMRAAVRVIAQEERSPARILSRLNRVLSGPLRPEQHVTALVAFLDLPTLKLTLANAGHCEPVIQSNGRGVLLETMHKSPLGAFRDTAYAQSEHQLHKGDRLIIYTDGIIGARSGNWRYGEDRLLRTLSENKDLDAQEMAEAVMESALSFAEGKLSDDAVVGVLRLT